MSNYLWVKTQRRQELLDIANEIPEYGRKKTSEILEMALEEFVKKHGKSNNPQSQITQFGKQGILQVPNIYEATDDPETWKKFYGAIKNKKEMDPRNLLRPSIQAVEKVAIKNMKLFGSAGQVKGAEIRT